MKPYQPILLAVVAALMVIMGCAHIPSPGTEVYSASFGLLDGANNLTPTNRIPHQVGVMYAWRLTVHSNKSKVRVKEVFKLPSSAPWTGNPSVPDAMTIISERRSQSGNISVKEFDLEIGVTSHGETKMTQPYQVINGDPQGTHKISIFVEGKLIEEFIFQVF